MLECFKSRTGLGKRHNFCCCCCSDWCEMLGCFSCKVNRKVSLEMWLPPPLGGESVICLPKALVAFNLSKRCKLGAVCQSKLSKWNNTRVAHTQTRTCSPIPQTLILNWVRRSKSLGQIVSVLKSCGHSYGLAIRQGCGSRLRCPKTESTE